MSTFVLGNWSAFSSPKGFFARIISDPTALTLLLSNLFTLVIALMFNWPVVNVLWVYWSQSVIIGFFHFFRLLLFSKGLERFFLAPFFAVHYGGFHFGYFIFLLVFSSEGFFGGAASGTQTTSGFIFDPMIVVTIFAFFISHGFSFLYHIKDYREEHADVAFMEPYGRIIPMHLTIIFGGFFMMLGIGNMITLIIFTILKTGADLAAHQAKHAESLRDAPVMTTATQK